MFCVAYISKLQDSDQNRLTFHNKSIRAITVGRSKELNCLLFYHPPTQQTFTSEDFRIDETLAAGPTFSLQYDGGLFVNKFTNDNPSSSPTTFLPDQKVFIKQTPNYKIIPASIIAIPHSTEDIYTVSYQNNGGIHQHNSTDIYPQDPSLSISSTNPPDRNFPLWIVHDCKVTLFTQAMKTPKHGFLLQRGDDWFFRLGRRISNPSIPLPDFVSIAHTMVSQSTLAAGHVRHSTIINACNSGRLQRLFARQVSATNLTSQDVPTLLQHNNLCPSDKSTWVLILGFSPRSVYQLLITGPV